MNTRRKPKLGADVWAAALREHGHLSDVDIAKRLGVTPPSVAYQRRKAGYQRVWVQTPPAPATDVAPQAPKLNCPNCGEGLIPATDWGADDEDGNFVTHPRECGCGDCNWQWWDNQPPVACSCGSLVRVHVDDDSAYAREVDGDGVTSLITWPAKTPDAATQVQKPRRQLDEWRARFANARDVTPRPIRDWPEIFRVYGHLNNRKIGAIVGVTYQAVSLQRRKLGLEGPYKRRDMQEWARIFAANPGKTNRELAEIAGLDVGDNTLSRARKVLGISPPPPQPPKLKCTPEQVVALQGLTDSEIAERLGCHPSTVYMVRRKHGIPSGRELQRRSREVFE